MSGEGQVFEPTDRGNVGRGSASLEMPAGIDSVSVNLQDEGSAKKAPGGKEEVVTKLHGCLDCVNRAGDICRAHPWGNPSKVSLEWPPCVHWNDKVPALA